MSLIRPSSPGAVVKRSSKGWDRSNVSIPSIDFASTDLRPRPMSKFDWSGVMSFTNVPAVSGFLSIIIMHVLSISILPFGFHGIPASVPGVSAFHIFVVIWDIGWFWINKSGGAACNYEPI